jgi:hypothetical protein
MNSQVAEEIDWEIGFQIFGAGVFAASTDRDHVLSKRVTLTGALVYTLNVFHQSLATSTNDLLQAFDNQLLKFWNLKTLGKNPQMQEISRLILGCLQAVKLLAFNFVKLV